jgi:predicted nucleic acid-binding protein
VSLSVDVIDTQILVYGANRQESWAETILDELLEGSRVAYVPRYVLAEFSRVLVDEFRQSAREVITGLFESDTVASAHVRQTEQLDVETTRNTATARALAQVCGVEPKDAPILAAAAQLYEFLQTADPYADTVRYPEQHVLLSIIREAGYDPTEITPRILTNEKSFVKRPLDDLRLSGLEVERVSGHDVP